MKPVVFLGDALRRVKAFPEDARRTVGHELRDVQNGDDPGDWKPMPSIGVGVREIRIREASGAFRVVYLANLNTAVYVLHAFQKKTQATAKADIELARTRLRTLLTE